MRGHFSSGGEDLDKYYNDEDIQKVINKLKGSTNQYDLAICFSSFVALRVGEIRSIKYSDYNPIQHTLKIVRSTRVEHEIAKDVDGHLVVGSKYHQTESRLKYNLKSSKRMIPLTDEAEKIIETVHSLNPENEYLFMNNGRQISPDALNAHLKRACEAVGVRYRSIHKLRFFNARRLYNIIGLEKTSLILGHSSTAQTLQYIKQDGLSEADISSIREK